MNAVFAALGDPVRRRVLQLLAGGEQSVGEIAVHLSAFAPISQPAVSQHLRTLRDAGLVAVRADGNRRLYALDPGGVDAARDWLDALLNPAAPFAQPLDALATEIARGRLRGRQGAKTTQPERPEAADGTARMVR